MTPRDYCYQKAAPPGSMLYFSVRKLAREEQDAVVAIFAFYREIEDITLNFTDPALAQIKLNWWRDEVIHIQDATPSHPVAVMLQESLQRFSLAPMRLLAMIDGLEQNLTQPVFAVFSDVVVHVMRTAGERELLIADVLRARELVDPEWVYQLTLVVELVYYLQHLRGYVRRDLIYFSQEELAQFQVSAGMLREFVTTPSIRELLACQAEKIERSYALMIGKESVALKNLQLRSRMALAVLRAMRDERFDVLEKFINVTPLRYWWVAFKS